MGAVTLDISFTDTVIWQGSANSSFRLTEQADIWCISVHDHLHLLKTFAGILSPDELARANRYLRKEDHDRFIISRASLRYILSKYINRQPNAIEFQLEANKKPYIANSVIQYNLSDSSDYVLIGIAKKPLGIDIEYIKPKFYYETILPLNFNEPEIAFINEANQSERFFMLWTRKEAILKATGIGLTDHLKQIPALDGKYSIDGNLLSTDDNWRLLSFVMPDDYIATIATDPSILSYNFYEFNFGELPA